MTNNGTYSTAHATVFINLGYSTSSIFINLRYSTSFDPNASSSGVSSYTLFIYELQREIHIHTFIFTNTGHKRLRSFTFTH
jgi:hypothetical protein